MCITPGLPGYDSPLCKVYRSGVNPKITIALWGLDTLNAPVPQPFPFCGANGELCLANATTFWQEVQAAAEEAYDRSPSYKFTSFVGYEWSGTPGGANIHRNVIFRNEKVPALPISYLQTGEDPRVLWSKLRTECLQAGTGCDVLTIPHNANLSDGELFKMPALSKADGAERGGGRRLVGTRDAAQLRARDLLETACRIVRLHAGAALRAPLVLHHLGERLEELPHLRIACARCCGPRRRPAGCRARKSLWTSPPAIWRSASRTCSPTRTTCCSCSA
jgi:Protein of unknown function (DUF3604)